MDRELIRRWNERVQPGDTVYHLGDLVFKGLQKAEEYLDQLHGRVIIIKGNHDWNNDVKSKIVSAVIRHGGHDIWLSHYPEYVYELNLCGHVHENWKIQRRGPRTVCNVGVDVWDFRPIRINDILKELQESKKKSK